MSLLSPWFLAGLALLAGPIIAHLIRRATRDRISFSALRFLSPSAPRLDRRSRIQHPLLLALRLLILALLVLAFTRPYFTDTAPPVLTATPPRHVIAVLDASASMQRGSLWTEARARVQDLAEELTANDAFTLLIADTSSREILSPTSWQNTPPSDRASLLAGILDTVSAPGWSAFHLDNAVRAALENHQELSVQDQAEPAAPVIHILSDFAAGSRVSGLASVAWPTGVSVLFDPVRDDAPSNIAMQWLGWTPTNEETPEISARVRLIASPETPTTSVELRWFDPATDTTVGPVTTQVISRGGTAIVLMPLPADAPEALGIRLQGDAVAFDDRLWVVRPVPRNLPVVMLGNPASDDSSQPGYYLSRAIAGWRDPLPHLTSDLPAVDANERPALIIALDSQDVTPASVLRQHLENGATVLLLATNTNGVNRAAELLDERDWTASVAVSGSASGYALLGQIDFAHPLFLPFSDPRYSDFSRIRFWSHPRIALPAASVAQVVARYDDDSPAVLEATIGRGHLVVWAGGWTPTESQWVLSSKFVPWLQALAERTAGGPLRAAVTGLDQMDRLGSYTSLQPMVPGRDDAAAPGVYQLIQDNLPPRTVALNVPTIESELAPLDLDVFAQLGVPTGPSEMGSEASERARQTEAATVSESRQKLWRWLLLAAALLLIVESALSLRLARRSIATT